MSHFLPGFPVVLALFSRLSGLDPTEACRWLHAGVFGFNIFLTGLLFERYTQSALISTAGACAFLFSPLILVSHSTAMSEPLFISFMLLWLIFFMDFIEVSSRSSFILSIITLMLACLTRWTGVPLVLTSVAGIFLFKKESIKTRWIHAAVLMSVSLLPLLLWMAGNAVLKGLTVNGELVFHPHDTAQYNIFNKFVFIGRDNMFFSGAQRFILTAVMLFIGIIIWGKRDKEELAKIPDRVVIFIGLLFCCWLIYYVSFALNITFIDNLNSFRNRHFLPLWITWLLLVGMFLSMLLASNKKHEFLKLVFIVLCLFVGGSNLSRTVQEAWDRYYNGVDFDSKSWENSKIIAEVKKIPLDKILYTNSSDVIYFFAQRGSWQLMPRINQATTKRDPEYPVLMARMKKDFKAHKAILVYLDTMAPEYKPSLEDITREIPLKAVVRVLDGTIYEWDDHK